MNKVTLIGNVTNDLELKYCRDGKVPYVKFTLATNEYNYAKKETEGNYISIVAFGRNAENLSKYITKGRKLAVEGKIKSNTYTDLKGDIRHSTDVVLDSFTFLSYKNKNLTEEVI